MSVISPIVAFLDKYGLANTSGARHVRRRAALDAARAGLSDIERVHDIIEWLGTDIESVMRTEGEEPRYQAWIDASVKAHMLLSGCRNHRQAEDAS